MIPRFVIATTVVLVVVLILLNIIAKKRYDNYLSGLWVGDPGFLDDAQLSDLQLFIAPSESGCRQGYLIMKDVNGEFIANQAVTVYDRAGMTRFSTTLKSSFSTSYDCRTTTNFEIEYDNELEAPFPSDVQMTISILDGSMKIFDEDRVYAFMSKDMATSAAAISAYNDTEHMY